MFGYIIEYCKTNDYLLSIFTSFDKTLGWIEFYINHFKNYKFEVKHIYTFEEMKDKFDIIFVTTDDDYAFKSEWINDKCVSINHTCMIRRLEFKNNLGTRPFIKNYKKWAIPCYNIFQENDKETTLNKDINISIIGGLNDYNYNTINRLHSSSNINLYIIARNANNFNISNIINKNINTILFNNIDTDTMINLLKSCDYILSDATYNIHHINGISMSGNIPLSFSTLTPIIISKGNNNLYKFKNVIEFDIKLNDKIIIEKGMINISALEKERQKIISMFNDYNDILLFPDKYTALIVDPRNNENLPYLINDFKKKLGNNWRIVFYCGKGLQNKMNQYIENNIEIRELNVNNFTINEYSDFMKSKELWQTLYGDFVLTFQADTYILNKAPYTIEYFINMDKSYIGGNMDHRWSELNRENIYPNYRNFNGGLSLRKRQDMITIIDTLGTEKTEHNSQKIQTDPEDVYFTIGCYKLNYPIGDTSECQHFSLNRIRFDKFFGIHKPIPDVLQNFKEVLDIYSKETNTFILKPKKQSILFILPNWYNLNPLEDYFDSLKNIYNIIIIIENHELTNFNIDYAIFVCIVSDNNIYSLLKKYNIDIGILNTEPLNMNFRLNNFKEHIPSELDKNAKIYDYSLSNIQILNKEGYLNTHHLPYQIYEKENIMLTNLYKNTPKEYDFGIVSYENPIILEKRKNVVNYLINKKYSVNIIHGWKEDRDKELAKCSIILNIHGQCGDYDSQIFEHIRCDRLLEAGFKILSEDSYLLDEKFIKKYPNLKLTPFNEFFNIDIYSKLNWLRNEDKSIKIIDCFTFYNELNMLNYRLNILNDVVDYFILVEAKQTHVGKEKKLFYDENKQMFEKFNDKIIHIVVDLPFNESNIDISNGDQWTNEIFQRNCISQGLEKIQHNLNNNDHIVIADVDEIPDPKTLLQIKNKTLKICDINVLEQEFYYYNLNSKRNEYWYRCKTISYKKYRELNVLCNEIRFFSGTPIKNGGWHLSYFGDANFIKNKLENFAHQEYNSSTFTNTDNISEKINNGLDLFNRDKNNTSNIIQKISIDNNTYLPPFYETYLSSFYT